MEFQCTTATSYQRRLRVVPLLCLASCCSHLSCGWVVGPLCCCWGRTAYGIGVAFYSTTYLLVHYKAGEKHLQFYYARPSRGLRAAHGPPSVERYFWQKKRFTYCRTCGELRERQYYCTRVPLSPTESRYYSST
jgi:hypothetical protein